MDDGLAAISRRSGVLLAREVSLDGGGGSFESGCRRVWALAVHRAGGGLRAAEVSTRSGTLVLVRRDATGLAAALTAPGTVASVVRYELERAGA